MTDDRTADADAVTGDTLRERVREDVDRRLDALRERFGAFPVAEETVENDPERFEHGRERAAAGWRGDAGAFVTGADGRLLLVRHGAAPDRWGVPGGAHEPGESFVETARREVREETGVDCEVTDVWQARRRTFVHAAAPDRRLETLTVRFEADARTTVVDVDDDEIVAARWFGHRPDAVHDELAGWVDEWSDGR